MSEGPTNAAQADVGGEDHPVDGPASTGTTGAGDATGAVGTNGHDGTAEGHEGTAEGHDGTAEGHDGTAAGTTSGAATTTSGAGSEADATTTDVMRTDATTTDAVTTDGDRTDAATSDAEATTETVPAATLPGEKPAPTASGDAVPAADGDEEWADAEDTAYRKELRKGFAFGAVGGVLIGAIVALLLGALVWPGYLLGPGSPDDTANQVTAALAAKDGPTLDRLSCKGADGRSVTQLSGQVLQYVTKVAPAGPTTTLIDTEARTPIDVTLSVQGQTQTLPSELVLGESKGDWCLKGLAQRQQ
jgi:hypothetical protein